MGQSICTAELHKYTHIHTHAWITACMQALIHTHSYTCVDHCMHAGLDAWAKAFVRRNYTNAHTFIHMRGSLHACRPCICTQSHKYTHTHTHARVHAFVHNHTNTNTHATMHAFSKSFIPSQLHRYKHTHTHACVHAGPINLYTITQLHTQP